MDQSTTTEGRHYIRFHADPNSLSWINEDLTSTKYDGGIVGLTVNESASGCSVLFVSDKRIQVNKSYRMIVGKLAEVLAEVRWIRELDDYTIRVGFEYKT